MFSFKNSIFQLFLFQYVIVANRRATAAAFQVMICHLFGDATSPYIVGVISDAVRGSFVQSSYLVLIVERETISCFVKMRIHFAET